MMKLKEKQMVWYGHLFSLCVVAILGSTSCTPQYTPKFDKPSDVRVTEALKDLQTTLCDADFGWRMYYSLGDINEYIIYQIATFRDDNTVALRSGDPGLSESPKVSEYRLGEEGGIKLSFTTHNDNLTFFATPTPKLPNGLGADLELLLVSKNEDEIIFQGKRFQKAKLRLVRLDKPVNDFQDLTSWKNKILSIRGKGNFLSLHITEGLPGASAEHPFPVYLELSPSARIADYKYNNEAGDSLFLGRKMLFFDHKGMGFSSPIEVGGKGFQYMVYDPSQDTFVIDDDGGLKGYLKPTQLPEYHLPKLYEDFMKGFSQQIVRAVAGGEMLKRSAAMKRANSLIQQVVICTNYHQRIPKIQKEGKNKGEYVLDDVFNHDYTKGERLGNGIFLCFDGVDQFYGYFVPVEYEKVKSDVIRIKRSSEPIKVITNHPEDKHSPTQEEAEKKLEAGKDALDAYISFICSETPWLIKKTREGGRLDWDFISTENPKNNFFITRLK